MKRVLLLFVFLNVTHRHPLIAQCVASGYLTANTTGNNNSIGLRDWNTTNLVTASDNNYSSVLALLIGDDTHYHVSSNYGFSIPATASICGIEITVEKGEGGLLANVRDNSVRIIKGGLITGTEHASAAGWGGTDGAATYGSSSDTWGMSWTPADINSNSFGLAFSANLGGVAVLPSARIDQIRIRVWYNNILPVELTSFETTCSGENIRLQWETASEIQNDHFDIQHSLNGEQFATIYSIAGNGTTNVMHQYSFEHERPGTGLVHYYRLVQYDVNGDSVVSEIQSVNCRHNEAAIQVSLSMQDMIQVSLTGFNQPVQVSAYDLSGNVLCTHAVETHEGQATFSLGNTAAFKSGCYLVTATSEGRTYPCKIILTR